MNTHHSFSSARSALPLSPLKLLLITIGISLGLILLQFSLGAAFADSASSFLQEDPATGAISISKVTTPAGGTGFGFSSDIPDGGSFTLNDTDSITFAEIPVGIYTITEDDPGPLYSLTGLACSSAGSPIDLDLENRAITIDLTDEDSVQCTFYNDKQAGSISISKATTPAGGTGFGFSSDIPDGGSFTLNDTDSITFAEIPVGTYTITEDDPGPLYSLTGLACSSAGSPIDLDLEDRAITIDLTKGDSVQCTFFNESEAPQVTVDVSSQDVQYSDLIQPVNISATDKAADVLSLTTEWSYEGGAFAAGLPDALSTVDNGCSVVADTQTCSWTISGPARMVAGQHTIRATVSDDNGNAGEVDILIMVYPEDANVWFDDLSPSAVPVSSPGSDSSEAFDLLLNVQEKAEDDPSAAPGDINLAAVTMTLDPLSGGPSHTIDCAATGAVAPYDYGAILQVACPFSGLPVDVYQATATVGGGYYEGAAEDVVVVYDPSLGFTTGGGWFYWPGSADAASGYPGDKTTFGFNVKFNKNGRQVKGNLLLIRHTADGSIYRLKSNALEWLTLTDAVDPLTGENYAWASFSGKATFRDPGMPEPEGNYSFSVYVEDRGVPGAEHDRFWLEVIDKDNQVETDLSLAQPAPDNAMIISGGNIVVPHETND